jgi:DNA primase
VSYDPDSAGIAATQRSLDLFLEEEFRVKVLQLPEGQDPDTFIRKTGVEQYRSRLKESTPYLDFVLDTALRSQGVLDSPRKKIQVLNAVLPYLAKLPNAVERSDYVFRFARRLQIEDKLLLAEVKRAAQQKKTRLPDVALASLVSLKKAEKKLLQLLLGDLTLQAVVLPNCSSQDFEGLVAEKLFVKVLERHRSGQVSTFDYLHREFAGEPEQTWLAQMEMEELPESRSRDTAQSCLNALRGSRLSGQKEQLLAKIAEAAERRDDEMLNQLIEQRVQIDRQLVSLSRK